MTISERIEAARRERRVLARVCRAGRRGPRGSRFVRGAGNNRAVGTVMASSFLNAAGRLGGWSAWPERVVGVARPLAGLAALVSPGLPRVLGPLQLRG